MNKPDKEAGRRWKEARSSLGMNQAAFSGAVGTSQSFYSRVESGICKPNPAMLAAVRHLGFSLDWLLTGTGEMRLASTSSTSSTPSTPQPPAPISRRPTVLDLADVFRLPADDPPVVLPPDPLPVIIGKSAAIRALIAQVFTAAVSGRSVLLVGEPGTGKELSAHGIHEYGSLRHEPFRSVDCAAIRALAGVSLPNPAVIYLHRLHQLPADLVSSLIVLVKRPGLRLVGGSYQPANTLPRDLRRLFTLVIHLPALRNRHEDIGLIADYLLRAYRRLHQRPDLELASPTWDLLLNYRYPGNVRELRFLMHHLVKNEPFDRISVPTWRDAVSRAARQDHGQLDGFGLRDSERTLIRQAFVNHANDVNHAARSVGLDPMLFQFLCFHLGVPIPTRKPAPTSPADELVAEESTIQVRR